MSMSIVVKVRCDFCGKEIDVPWKGHTELPIAAVIARERSPEVFDWLAVPLMEEGWRFSVNKAGDDACPKDAARLSKKKGE